MDRSRSKRNYHYEPDSTSPSPPPRSKPRYDAGHRRPNHHRRVGDRRLQPPPPPPPLPLPPPPPPLSSSSAAPGVATASPAAAVTTFFCILCPNVKSGAVIGKSMSVIKTIRQETGAWITVHPLVPGDEEYIIETADDRRREPDGRPPQFSPAQDALLLIHRRIVDAEFDDDDEDGYGGDGGWGGGGGGGERDRGRMTTRLVVPRLHVGCLLGKGGKIIEQMRMETKTHIRILPRDQYTPRCVSTSEEVVQIVGEGTCVKKAVAIISARLKESLHRDRGNFRGRIHSPEHHFPPEEEFLNNTHLSAVEESDLGSRFSVGPNRIRINYGPEPSGYAFDSDGNPINDRSQSFSYEDMVFRILCPNNKVDSIIGAADGILEILQADVGVDVRVGDPVAGSDEQIIIITSDEGPGDELFPAQEALLHIQTHIVDLGPDKDNIITTRLLVSASEIACLEGRDGSLSDIQRLTSANVQILPKEDLPLCAVEADELVQIVGEIRAARNALVHVTAKLRSHLYRDLSVANDSLQTSCVALDQVGVVAGHESTLPIKGSSSDAYQANDPPMAIYQHKQSVATAWHSKDTGGSASGSFEQEESNFNDESKQSSLKRFSVPLVTRSTLEVVIPKSAVPSLIMRSGSKLAQISEMSGATVTLIEDRPELTEKVVQISGSPEQAERAQSLLQGFILSTLDDIPSS